MSIYKGLSGFYNLLLETKLHDGTKLQDVIDSPTLRSIALALSKKISLNNQELVTEFNDTFKVERETDNRVDKWNTKELRLALILEESVELAFALGFDQLTLRQMLLKAINKAYSKSPLIDNGEKTVETFDALLDLLYVTYGALDCFNLSLITKEGMEEVHASNMSKICETQDILKETVSKYNIEGIKLVAEKQEDNTYIVRNRETRKVLKSINYTTANLLQILIKHKIL